MQESTATANLSEMFSTLKEAHERQIERVRTDERIRMLECVKALYNDQKIDQEALELLALEIAMGE